MKALLQAELIKPRTIALVCTAVGVSLLITILVAVLTEPTDGRC